MFLQHQYVIARHGEAQGVDDAYLIDEIGSWRIDGRFRGKLQWIEYEALRQRPQIGNVILTYISSFSQSSYNFPKQA